MKKRKREIKTTDTDMFIKNLDGDWESVFAINYVDKTQFKTKEEMISAGNTLLKTNRNLKRSTLI